jgi:LacI family transcriptional regulator
LPIVFAAISMAKKKISIKDIANTLGISITTVSFILNGKAREKRISEELTKKVTDYIKEVNYQPSHLAQSLRSGKSKVLVLMVEDISNHFFATIARLIEEKAYRNGYKIIYCSTENNPDKAIELISTFKARNVDGFIITPTPQLAFTIQQLLDEEYPVILFDRWMPEVNCSYVIVENKNSAFDGTVHLIKNHCKNIALISVESDQTQMEDRKNGYLEAMNMYNLPPHVFELPYSHISDETAAAKIQQYIESMPRLDGLFFSTNYLAFEGLKAIRNLGIEISGSLAILTFDDHYFFSLFQPQISAIAQPIEELAEALINGILTQLEEPENKTISKITLENQLYIRESSFLKS